MACAEFLDDRVEHIRGASRQIQGPGGIESRDRTHSPTRAPCCLAQGDLRADAGRKALGTAKKAIQVNQRWPKSRFSEKEVAKLIEMLTKIHE
jgi:hypothetical protein